MIYVEIERKLMLDMLPFPLGAMILAMGLYQRAAARPKRRSYGFTGCARRCLGRLTTESTRVVHGLALAFEDERTAWRRPRISIYFYRVIHEML